MDIAEAAAAPKIIAIADFISIFSSKNSLKFSENFTILDFNVFILIVLVNILFY